MEVVNIERNSVTLHTVPLNSAGLLLVPEASRSMRRRCPSFVCLFVAVSPPCWIAASATALLSAGALSSQRADHACSPRRPRRLPAAEPPPLAAEPAAWPCGADLLARLPWTTTRRGGRRSRLSCRLLLTERITALQRAARVMEEQSASAADASTAHRAAAALHTANATQHNRTQHNSTNRQRRSERGHAVSASLVTTVSVCMYVCVCGGVSVCG